MPHPGQMLGDRYRLDDRIAAGGMGEVWQATDTVLGRDVAVKTLHAGRAGDAGFQTRFKHEARAMAVLHHPGVADVYDYGQTADGSDAYIVMAHVHGQALNNRIAEHGTLSPAETMSIVAQAGRALEAAHQAGIVHRDVKPGNLIIEPDGTVVLVDFGVARSAESPDLTGAKEVVGTALYIAPEQVSKKPTGPSADIYALGAVAFHCLTGHPPFEGKNPITVALQHLHDDPPPLPQDIPFPVRRLVETALSKDPDSRYPSAAAMAAAADAALGEAAGQETAILAATPPAARTRPGGFVPGVAPISPATRPGTASAQGGPAAVGFTPGRAGQGGNDAAGFTPGRAGQAGNDATRPVSGSGTAILPAVDVPDDPQTPGPIGPLGPRVSGPGGPGESGGSPGRKRTLLIGLLVALVLAGGGIALAAAKLGGNGDPVKPVPSVAPGKTGPASVAPTAKKTGQNGQPTNRPSDDGKTSTAPSNAPNPGGPHQGGTATATGTSPTTADTGKPTTAPTTEKPTDTPTTPAADPTQTGTADATKAP